MAYRVTQGIEDNQIDHALHIAFELSLKSWKLGFSDGRLRSPQIVNIDTRDFEQLHEEVRKSFIKFGLAAGSWASHEDRDTPSGEKSDSSLSQRRRSIGWPLQTGDFILINRQLDTPRSAGNPGDQPLVV